MDVLISFGRVVFPFLLLLYVHFIREAVHTAGRLYIEDLVNGEETYDIEPIITSTRHERLLMALRLARVLALALWVFGLAWALSSRWAPPSVLLGSLVLALMGDELARVAGQWVSIRSSRMRRVLNKHARAILVVLSPVVWFFTVVARRLFGLDPVRDMMLAVNEDQIVIVAREEESTPIRAAERELIDNIFDFRETIVREVMVPRLDIVAVPVESHWKDALDVIVEHGHSRVPVYENNIDQIVGILYAKDILAQIDAAYPEWPNISLKSIVRPPYYVPDSKRVSELLAEMQQRKVHLAIVVDEYGGTAGLITIEDLLEEIVGEIQDEYDRETPEMQRLNENEYLINARAEIEDVSDFIGVPLPEDEADTLGGLIYTRLERIPVVGDEVRIGRVRLRVVSLDGHRIRFVQVVVEPEDEQETSPSETAQREVKHG